MKTHELRAVPARFLNSRKSGSRTKASVLSVVWVITVSPCWYMRDRGPQTALSGVGDPTERQTSLRVFPSEE